MESINETTTTHYLTRKTRQKFHFENRPIPIGVSVIFSFFKSLELSGWLCVIFKLIMPHKLSPRSLWDLKTGNVKWTNK